MEIQKQEVILKIEDLTKSFGKTEVLKGISMEVHKNEIISVLGPSGCGKSTLLNIIAGMLAPDDGRVTMNGQMISEAGKVQPLALNADNDLLPTASIPSRLRPVWFA